MGVLKYDYSSKEFTDRLEEFAKKGYTDKEIAFELDLNQTHFSELKNSVTEMSEALARGRAKINNIVRQRLLQVGLGGIKTKRITRRKLEGLEGEGEVVLIEETELAPNANVLSTWLFNHDPEWRDAVLEGKRLDVTTNGKDIPGNTMLFISQDDLSTEALELFIKRETEGNFALNESEQKTLDAELSSLSPMN